MGNSITMDWDEEYMKGMIWSPKQLDICDNFCG